MSMLTSKRVNGIKDGYWSPAKKDDLIQKLGPIENAGPALLARACETLCRRGADADCRGCPLQKLSELIDGRYG